MDVVQAKKFYMDDGDKIKLNWFCYEFANNLFMAIRSAPKLAIYRERHSEKEIIDFCVYFSKRLRKSIYDKNSGRFDAIAFRDSYVYGIHPNISVKQKQALMNAAMSSWNIQVQSCKGCSNNCLIEEFELTDMFDNLDKTGWPT